MSWVEKKVRDLGRKIDDKIIQPVLDNPVALAGLALNFVAPGAGTAIGSALGATGVAAPIVGQAVIGAGLGAATGGDPLKSALIGGVMAGAAPYAGSIGEALGATGDMAQVVGQGVIGGTVGAATGGDPLQSALMSAGTAYAGQALRAMQGDPTVSNPTVQTMDDGSSIQTFDDGSTLVTNSAGQVSATPASLLAPTASSEVMGPVAPSYVGNPYDYEPAVGAPTGGGDVAIGNPYDYEPAVGAPTGGGDVAIGNPYDYEQAVNAPTPGTAWGSPEMYETEFTPTVQTPASGSSWWENLKIPKGLIGLAGAMMSGAMNQKTQVPGSGGGGGGGGGGDGRVVPNPVLQPYVFTPTQLVSTPMPTTRQIFGPMYGGRR